MLNSNETAVNTAATEENNEVSPAYASITVSPATLRFTKKAGIETVNVNCADSGWTVGGGS